MKRKKLYKKVFKLITREKKLSKDTMENSTICHTDEYKQGIYFLYNKSNKIIYVGKIGDRPVTSLYYRLKGHGNAAHCKKAWYVEVEYGKFHKFGDLDNNQLAIVERLCIQFNKNVDNYNDKLMTAADLDEISEKI